MNSEWLALLLARLGLHRIAPGLPRKGSAELLKDQKRLKLLATPTGFEPVTPRLGIWCSIHLSYGAVVRTKWLCTSLRPLDRRCSHELAASISSMAPCRI